LRRIGLALIACALPVLWAWQVLLVWNIPDADLQDAWGDATTYLAAGERLNQGHDLYALTPGDRPVLILDNFTAPLLSPPPIAALWRPLAVVPFGLALWVGACWVALLATIWYLVIRLGLPATVVVAALSWPLGEQLAAANVSAFFPGLLLLVWLRRDTPRWGLVLGALAALKLAPAVMGGWWVGTHGRSGMSSVLSGAAALGVVGLIGAGVDAFRAYLAIPASTQPSSLSVAGLLGAPWFPYVGLAVGAVAAAGLRRYPRLAFSVAYVAMMLGNPAVYVATFGLLIGLLIPFVSDEPRAVIEEPAASGDQGVGSRFAWTA
jgi:hypothetical protein